MIRDTLKRITSALVLATFLILPATALTTGLVAAQSAQDDICKSVNLNGSGCDTAQADADVSSTIELVINMFSLVVGIVAVIMIIIGGLKYVTSSGDSNNISSAKNTILYAIIGLVVVALSQVIVRFVLDKVS